MQAPRVVKTRRNMLSITGQKLNGKQFDPKIIDYISLHLKNHANHAGTRGTLSGIIMCNIVITAYEKHWHLKLYRIIKSHT